jgi:hypothetical protein
MHLSDFEFLRTDEGQVWLGQLAETTITPANHLQIATQLRKQFSPTHTQALLETAVLRQRATTKFSRAAQMYFTRPGLEQASSEIVSRYRAKRFQEAGIHKIADLGCSIGGDALAMAEEAEVTGVEWDPVRLAMAQENVHVYGNGARFHPLQADLLSLSPLPVDGLFFDPARRDERGRRFFSVHEYQPPLSFIDKWREVVWETAVKISPGVDYAELPNNAEVEFISVNGDVKEAVLWYGSLNSGVQRRATLLPTGHTLTTKDDVDEIAVTKPKQYLFEPDGAVIRAHLVETLATILNATKIDTDIAYLTANKAIDTPYARCFSVEDMFPFQLKRLRKYLHERKIGRVTIKKRGSALDPDKLRQQLRLKKSDTGKCVVFLTFVKGETAVIIGQEMRQTKTGF